MINNCKFLLTIFVTFLMRSAGQSYYSIVAPNTLRPNSQYHVAVSVHNAEKPLGIRVSISGSKYTDFKAVEINPFTTRLIQFDIPNISPDRYLFTVEGVSGILFYNETALFYENKQFTVLVQTDKAIYKPNDRVQFRVLSMDANLKASSSRPMAMGIQIVIRDGGQNVIQTWSNVTLESGIVYSNELLLSDYLKFGEWSIEVTVATNEVYRRTFEVLEYILPKFVIDIDTARHVNYKENKIIANIRAYYAFGKPIKGEATLSIYPTFFGSLQPFVNDLITRKVQPIYGESEFEFDIIDELQLKQDYEREYLLDVLVEEHSTGAVQNFSTLITVHLDPYKIDAVSMPLYYIPGIPFEVKIRVMRSDKGLLLNNFKTKFTAYLTNVYGSNDLHNKNDYNFDQNGESTLEFTVPVEDNNDYHSVIVDYLGIISDVGQIPRRKLNSKHFITTKLLTTRPRVNEEVNVNAVSSEPISYAMYQIVGRGDILISRVIQIDNQSEFNFKFLATFAMVPRIRLMVYLIIDGEFVWDEQVIQLEEKLLNEVKINAPSQISPGQEIDLIIQSKPFNYIGLMAVDRNALRLREGNDLSINGFMRALREYELNELYTPLETPGKTNGVITFTNAEYKIPTESSLTKDQRNSLLSAEDDNNKLYTIRKTDIGPAHAIEVNTLAPGKGRFAFSYTPEPFWHVPRIHVMHPSVDTWLFLNFSANSEGHTVIHRRLPDTTTTWALTAFSIDPVQGVGVTSSVIFIETLKKFYITMDLPASILLDEIIALPFVVYNENENDLHADVILHNTAHDFDFLPADYLNSTSKSKVELYSRRKIFVAKKDKEVVAFLIRPKRIETITIKVSVTASDGSSDTMEKYLLVELPGATEYISHGFLLLDEENSPINVSVRIPPNVIPNSAQIEIVAMGDLMANTLKNMEKLIYQPIGCGEQAMIQFLSNILLVQYLQDSQQLTQVFLDKTKRNLHLNYQRLLFYRQRSGAFSPFGLKDEKPSTWLTAYIVRVFKMADKFIEIERDVLNKAIEFVISNQKSDGSFQDEGYIFEEFNDDGLSLTAFVTLALLQNNDRYPKFENNINKALNYIVQSLDKTKSLHAMAIGTYVLSKTFHQSRNSFLQRFDAMAVHKDGLKWWNQTASVKDILSPWYNQTRNVNNEITSYGILALLENDRLDAALPAVKWLMGQRNEFGGFIGSQDTVLGLEATIAFVQKRNIANKNMRLSFIYGKNAETVLNVNTENSLTLQKYQLSNNVKNISLKISGRGMSFAQVLYRYNTNVTSAWPRFVLDPTVNRNSHSDYLHLSACASFIAADEENRRSNMAVMEIQLPSGFVVDKDTLPTLEFSERIKRVETGKKDTIVIIYFDYLDRRQVCPTLHAYKIFKVTNHRPVPVIMYDMYDNVKRARQFYRAPKSKICDICENANCGTICEKTQRLRDARRFDKNIDEELPESYSNKGSCPNCYTSFFLSLKCLLSLHLLLNYLFYYNF